MKTLAVCLLCAASALAQSALTEYLPARASVVIGVNARAIIDAAVLPNLSMDPTSLSAMMLAQKGLKGLNPLTDIDSVLIAVTGTGQNPPGLAVIRGRFDPSKLTTGAQYHGVPLIEDTNPQNMTAVLDATTLIAGDAPTVKAAIDGRGTPHASDPAMAARVVSLSSRFDIWAVGDSSKGFPGADSAAKGLEAIDRFEFGANFRKGLTIEAQAHVRTAKDAQELTKSLGMFEKMLNGQTTTANGTKFSLQSQNGTFKLALSVPEEELKKAIAAQKASIAAAIKPAPKPTRPEDVKIISRPNGDTMQVILPGGHQ